MESVSDPADPQELLDAAWKARLFDDRHDVAHELIVQSLRMARARNDTRAVANALLAWSSNLLWYCPPDIDRSDEWGRSLEEALRLFREIGDESGEAACLRGLGDYEESLAICRRINDQRGVIRNLQRLTDLAAVREALELARNLGDKELLAEALWMVALRCNDCDRDKRAAFLEAAELYETLRHRRRYAESLFVCTLVACDDDLCLKRELLERGRMAWSELGDHAMEATCINHLAELADGRGDGELAAELRGCAEEISKLPDR